MKLKKEFVTMLDYKQSITVSTDTKLFSGIIRGNEMTAFLLKCLETDTNVEELTEKVCNEYDVDHQKAKKDIEEFVRTLKSVGAIDG